MFSSGKLIRVQFLIMLCNCVFLTAKTVATTASSRKKAAVNNPQGLHPGE